MKEVTKKVYALIGLLNRKQVCQLMDITLYVMSIRLDSQDWKIGEVAVINMLYDKYFENEVQ